MTINTRYRGNELIPRAGAPKEYTKEQIQEILKCIEDVVYYAKTYFKIVHVDKGLVPFDVYDYQEEAMKAIQTERNVILCWSRQSGKTTAVIPAILHYASFNEEKTIAILANRAQTARQILDRIKKAFENLPDWLKPGVVEWNKSKVVFENGSIIMADSTNSDTVRGFSCVTDDTKICICDNEEKIYYAPIRTLLNKSKLKKRKGDDMYHIVYKTTNIKNGKIYIGYHKTSNLEDGYLGSGKILKKAIEKYGVESFKKEILFIFDNAEEALKKEKKMVNKDFVLRGDTYNISIGGFACIMPGKNNPFYGKKHDEKTKKIMSQKQKGVPKNTGDKVYFCGKIYRNFPALERMTGIRFTPRRKLTLFGNPKKKFAYFIDNEKQEIIEKKYIEYVEKKIQNRKKLSRLCRERFKGRPKSKEFKEKMSKIHSGKFVSEETRRKMSKNLKGKKAWNKGVKYSTETRRKISESLRGSKISEETKKKISEKLKGRKSAIKNKIWITNGEKIIAHRKEEPIPEGFRIGRK